MIWAHAGFDVPVERLDELLARYPGLLLELSYRSDIAPLGTLADDWRTLFSKWPDRILVGTDTHVGARWAELDALADEARNWLKQLPVDVAHRIAFANAADLIGLKGPEIRYGPGQTHHLQRVEKGMAPRAGQVVSRNPLP